MTQFDTAVINWLRKGSLSSANPRAALIDMDGTLYDSMPRHSMAWERMAREAGLDFEPGEFFLHEGRTGAGTLNILFNRTFGRDATADEIERLYRLKTQYFSELQDGVMPVAGACEVLEVFRAFGMDCVLVTGSGQGSLLSRLDNDFPGMFPLSQRVTGRDVVHGKPHPEPFERGMALARAQPSQSVVLENAPLGVEAASASGAFTVGVTTGPIDPGVLYDAGADVVFSSMTRCAEAMPTLLHALKIVKVGF